MEKGEAPGERPQGNFSRGAGEGKKKGGGHRDLQKSARPSGAQIALGAHGASSCLIAEEGEVTQRPENRACAGAHGRRRAGTSKVVFAHSSELNAGINFLQGRGSFEEGDVEDSRNIGACKVARCA